MMQELLERKREIRDRLGERNRRLFDTLEFLVRFTILSAPVYILLWQGWDPVWLRSLDAQLSSHVLSLIGVETTSSGTFLAANTITVDISIDSTGWKSMIAVTALMLATVGAKPRKRLYGILAGITAVFCANIIRIVSMVYAVEVLDMGYAFIHTVLWRWGLTVIVFGVWALWLQWDGEVPWSGG